jgi:hypothetical protein
MTLRPHGPPKQLPINLSTVDTSKGTWLIAVETIAETLAHGNLLLNVVLEQRIDDEHFRTRELGIKVRAVDARDADRSVLLLNRIRNWIETTEGDGFVDMVD